MFKKLLIIIVVFSLINIGFTESCLASTSKDIELNPYRVLVVIAGQWKDSNSYIIECEWNIPFDYTIGRPVVEKDFEQIVSLLKSWGIPFDILRLDQQKLNINKFIDRDKKPIYGCIIWDADQSVLVDQDYSVLEKAVKKYGISLIAISNRIKEPIIQELLGLKYKGCYRHSSRMIITEEHFITRRMYQDTIPQGEYFGYQKRVQALVDDSEILAYQGNYPQLTARDINESTKAVWIGGDYSLEFDSYFKIREILRRAITWCIGYSIYKTYPNTVIMVMDDPGTAQNAYLEHWHYHTLTKNEIEKYLIKPLQEHNAILVVNVCPGFACIESKKIIPSWTKQFTDPLGTYQDYVSTKEGLDKGLALGVFEIQSHGWTHMQPDLNSLPGSWWDAPIDGEKAEVGWYREFYDTRRDKEIPAEIQTYHMKKSIEGIKEQFSVTPLELRPGGHGVSLSYENNTARLAGLAGFGWCHGYCGKDYVIKNIQNMGGGDAPREIGAPPDAHDKGIAEYPTAFSRGLDSLGNIKYIGFNEYVGYLHAKIGVTGGQALELCFDYDDHYCQHFKNYTSTWTLHLSDRLKDEIATLGKIDLLVDGKVIMRNADPAKYLTETIKIDVPKGTGKHIITYKWEE